MFSRKWRLSNIILQINFPFHLINIFGHLMAVNIEFLQFWFVKIYHLRCSAFGFGKSLESYKNKAA